MKTVIGRIVLVVFFAPSIGNLYSQEKNWPDFRFDLGVFGIGYFYLSVPSELEAVPEIHNSVISTSLFSRANLSHSILFQASFGFNLRPLPYKHVKRLTLGYNLVPMYLSGYAQHRYNEGAGSESYVYTRSRRGEFFHEFFLGWTLFKENGAAVIGINYSKSKLKVGRGWYRYSKHTEFASEIGNFSIVSPCIIFRSRDKDIAKLSLDVGIISFPKAGSSGYSVGFRVQFYSPIIQELQYYDRK